MSLPWSSTPKKKEKKKYWIIDYSFYMYNGSFAYRSKCACRDKNNGEPDPSCSKCKGDGFTYMQSKSGHPIGGLYTIFAQIIERARQGFEVITVFDPPKDQLDRMKLLDTYKGGRPSVPEFITYQMRYGENLLPMTGVDCYYSDHAESDDVMAAIAFKLADEGHYVVVSTDDKDLFPVLSHKNIDIYRQRKMFTSKDFHSHLAKKEGIEVKDPGRFNEFLAICGDAADNFNLLSGLGPKAAEWIISNTKKSCIEIFDSLDEAPFKYQKKLVNCTKPAPEEGKRPVKCPSKACTGCKYMKSDKKTDLELSLKIATLDYKAEYRNINVEPNKEEALRLLEALDLNGAARNINYLF